MTKCLEESFSKVFGNEPLQSIGDFIRSKSPFFGASIGKIEAFQEKLGQANVEELKKDITEIEDNMTDNLDVVIESIESLLKGIQQTKDNVAVTLAGLINSPSGPLRLISDAKFQEVVNESAKTKAANKTLSEISRKVVKENTIFTKEIASLKEKLALTSKEVSDFKVKESKANF